MGDTRAIKGSNSPVPLADQSPHESTRLIDDIAGATGSQIRLFGYPWSFLFENHLALSALADRSGNGLAGCLAGSGGDDGGTPRPPVAPEGEPGARSNRPPSPRTTISLGTEREDGTMRAATVA
jgi:hypothetical protein